jgi:hypothetical protein
LEGRGGWEVANVVLQIFPRSHHIRRGALSAPSINIAIIPDPPVAMMDDTIVIC